MKRLFDKISGVLLMAMMAVVCVTFMTACGGGDDDPLDNPKPVVPGGDNNNSGNGGDNGTVNNGLVFYMPLMDWTATKAQVSAYMAKTWPELEYSDMVEVGNTSTYMKPDSSFMMYYLFGGGGLQMITLYYYDGRYSLDFFAGKVKEICGKAPEKIENGYYEVRGNGIHAGITVYANNQFIIDFEKDS